MPDYKLDKLLDAPSFDRVDEVQTQKLKPVAEAFKENLAQVAALALLPPTAYVCAGIYQRCACHAEVDVLGEIRSAEEGTPEREKVLRQAEERYNAALSLVTVDHSEPLLREAVEGIQSQVAGHPDMPFIQPWLSSLVVLSWTAFETLATDVWVEAVNCRPLSLGRNAWAGRRASNGESTKDESSGPDYPEDLLAEYGFNLSESMGRMMWRKRKYDFNSLDGIATAYKQAFRLRGKGTKSGVLPDVKQWLGGDEYDRLIVTESVRHLIVHRGGRADSAFLERVGNRPAFSQLRENDTLPLNGEFVSGCMIAATAVGTALLMGVDLWLTKNAG